MLPARTGAGGGAAGLHRGRAGLWRRQGDDGARACWGLGSLERTDTRACASGGKRVPGGSQGAAMANAVAVPERNAGPGAYHVHRGATGAESETKVVPSCCWRLPRGGGGGAGGGGKRRCQPAMEADVVARPKSPARLCTAHLRIVARWRPLRAAPAPGARTLAGQLPPGFPSPLVALADHGYRVRESLGPQAGPPHSRRSAGTVAPDCGRPRLARSVHSRPARKMCCVLARAPSGVAPLRQAKAHGPQQLARQCCQSRASLQPFRTPSLAFAPAHGGGPVVASRSGSNLPPFPPFLPPE